MNRVAFAGRVARCVMMMLSTVSLVGLLLTWSVFGAGPGDHLLREPARPAADRPTEERSFEGVKHTAPAPMAFGEIALEASPWGPTARGYPTIAATGGWGPVRFWQDTSMTVFLLGTLVGSVLLCLGIGLGIWVGRKRESAAEVTPGELQRLMQSFRGLLQWTSGMAVDVKNFQAVVDQVASQVEAADRHPAASLSPEADSMLTPLREANAQLRRRLVEAESALKQQADEVAAYISEARTDPLTKLPNRRVFNEELSRRLAEWRRHGTPVCMLIVDIDHFKRFNDTFGHLAGDAVLQGVAGATRKTLRESDIVSRLGGEEFAILLPVSEAPWACQAAERVRRAVMQLSVPYEGERLQVTVSCGAAQAGMGEESESLIKRADQALYAAKAAGRNRAFWHNGDVCLPVNATAGEAGLDGAPSGVRSLAQPSSVNLTEACLDLRRRLEEVIAGELETSSSGR